VVSALLAVLIAPTPAPRVAGVYLASLLAMPAFSAAYFMRMLIPRFR